MRARLPLIFMNSYSTQEATRQALGAYPQLAECGAGALPLTFLQNKVPKIWQETLQPVEWHQDPSKSGARPDNGDIYLTLHMSSLLRKMLSLGYEYMFVSNADNLGATVDNRYSRLFRSPQPALPHGSDRSHGRRPQGGAPCSKLRWTAPAAGNCPVPPEEIEQFQDIDRYRLFNTNNLWIHLPSLRELLQNRDGFLDLPVIVNSKPVDPSCPDSPPVFNWKPPLGWRSRHSTAHRRSRCRATASCR